MPWNVVTSTLGWGTVEKLENEVTVYAHHGCYVYSVLSSLCTVIVVAEERFNDASSEEGKNDTSHAYIPLCDARSGSSCIVMLSTVLLPNRVLLVWPVVIAMPLGFTHVMTGMAKSETGLATAQTMEYKLPADAVP